MEKTKKLVIIGDSVFAEIAYEYFTFDSCYEVVAFSVEANFLKRNELFGLPIIPFENIENLYNKDEIEFHAALTYGQLNRVRTRLYLEAKAKGFRPASYISSRAFVWRNVDIGEHCFIFEDNTVQPFAKIGNNVVLWSGNHIGHHSMIEDNCFISSHVVISGHSVIGRNSFIGVNAAIGNNITIGTDNWVGPSVTLTTNTEPNSLYKAPTPELAKVSATRFFKVKES